MVTKNNLEDCPKDITFPYYEKQMQQSTALGVSNSGNTDSAVILHFRGQNMEVINETKKPYWTIKESDVYVNYLSKQSSQFAYVERIYFVVNKSVENFSYGYEITKNSDNSVSGIINRFFGEIRGIYPTVCTYKRQTDSKFILAE